jgi:hypothetical protein
VKRFWCRWRRTHTVDIVTSDSPTLMLRCRFCGRQWDAGIVKAVAAFDLCRRGRQPLPWRRGRNPSAEAHRGSGRFGGMQGAPGLVHSIIGLANRAASLARQAAILPTCRPLPSASRWRCSSAAAEVASRSPGMAATGEPDRARFKRKLVELRARLLEEAGHTIAVPQASERESDMNDGSATFEQERLLAVGSELRARLDEVNHAIGETEPGNIWPVRPLRRSDSGGASGSITRGSVVRPLQEQGT